MYRKEVEANENMLGIIKYKYMLEILNVARSLRSFVKI